MLTLREFELYPNEGMISAEPFGMEGGTEDKDYEGAAKWRSAGFGAKRSGASRPRVTQMLASGALAGWKDGRNTRVVAESVNARLNERLSVTTGQF